MFRFAAIAAAVVMSMPAFADECSATVEGNDAMQYNVKSIDVPKSCKSFTVTLKHVGKLPKASMGHNWVLAKTADAAAVAKDGIAAGLKADYIKAGDPRVIAHTKMLGGGESDSVTIDVAGKLKAGEPYEYFCTFPGHVALMKGTLQIK
ncbi:MAG: azurin [Burkholderiaceae bacterium]|jgi:azurin|nr:azurin [Burkholderiaceae bacterium]